MVIKFTTMLKKLDYLFMILGTVFAVIGVILGIINHTSITWILITLTWIFVSFLKQLTIDRMEKIIDKMS